MLPYTAEVLFGVYARYLHGQKSGEGFYRWT